MLCGDAARRSRGLRDHIDGCGPGGLGLGASRPTGAEWQLTQYGAVRRISGKSSKIALSLSELGLSAPFQDVRRQMHLLLVVLTARGAPYTTPERDRSRIFLCCSIPRQIKSIPRPCDTCHQVVRFFLEVKNPSAGPTASARPRPRRPSGEGAGRLCSPGGRPLEPSRCSA